MVVIIPYELQSFYLIIFVDRFEKTISMDLGQVSINN